MLPKNKCHLTVLTNHWVVSPHFSNNCWIYINTRFYANNTHQIDTVSAENPMISLHAKIVNFQKIMSFPLWATLALRCNQVALSHPWTPETVRCAIFWPLWNHFQRQPHFAKNNEIQFSMRRQMLRKTVPPRRSCQHFAMLFHRTWINRNLFFEHIIFQQWILDNLLQTSPRCAGCLLKDCTLSSLPRLSLTTGFRSKLLRCFGQVKFKPHKIKQIFIFSRRSL
jgi:hypothetical protein